MCPIMLHCRIQERPQVGPVTVSRAMATGPFPEAPELLGAGQEERGWEGAGPSSLPYSERTCVYVFPGQV